MTETATLRSWQEFSSQRANTNPAALTRREWPAICLKGPQCEAGVFVVKTFGLFVITAIAEILGCYLPYCWLRKGGSIWLLVPAAASLAVFAWLLSLHPTAAGRVYAAYGGVYIATAIVWLWLVDGQRPTGWDLLGAAISVAGMAIIMFGSRPA